MIYPSPFCPFALAQSLSLSYHPLGFPAVLGAFIALTGNPFSMLFSNKVISNSDTQNSYYRNLLGGNHKSVFIPNGVDKDRFFINVGARDKYEWQSLKDFLNLIQILV